MKNVAILGASGFVGQEIIKICLNHPHVKIVALSANKSAGETVQIHDSVGIQTPLKYKSYEEINFSSIDYVFNCLPNENLHKRSDLFKSDVSILQTLAAMQLAS
jgi:N-acetyl-gamma-glutamyl-phosphate reductase